LTVVHSFAIVADEIKELLNDWMQKAYEKIMICLIWLIALLWTALVFTAKGYVSVSLYSDYDMTTVSSILQKQNGLEPSSLIKC
jgi:hypothetical protein